jgi:dihydropteroate synthase
MVMGIINVTPDSFYDKSRAGSDNEILKSAEKMINDGAAFLDIGGQSTRPGSSRVQASEELKRVVPAIDIIHRHFPEAILSIDTYHASVAKASIETGAHIVNDISAGSMDPDLIHTVAALKVPYICMHMRGDPGNMQQMAHYDHVTREVLDFFIRKTDELTKAGIVDVMIDPGFGFGKTGEHNFRLLKELTTFKMLEKPIVVGLSRKSTVYKTLGIPVDDALNGSTVLHTLALLNGADILRVHDVKEAMEIVRLLEAYNS